MISIKLTTRCSSCKHNINIKSNAPTRPDLQMEKGDEFNVNCHNCGHLEKKHVNDIRAESNHSFMLICVGIGILLTLILWSFFGAIGTVSITIPILLWYQQMDAKKAFNTFMIRRK